MNKVTYEEDINLTRKVVKNYESFIDWQKETSLKIDNIITILPDNQKIDLDSNFGYTPLQNGYEYNSRVEIENNLLYNITNIAIYMYEKFGKDASELIISLLKFYNNHTGLNFLDIDWHNTKELPEKFKDFARTNLVDQEFILYFLGSEFYYKYAKLDDKEKRGFLSDSHDKIYSLFTSHYFRYKLSKKLDILIGLPQIEYTRYLVDNSFENISNFRGISQKEFAEAMIEGAIQELEKLKEKREKIDEKDEKKIYTIDEKILIVEQDLELKNILSSLSEKKLDIISEEELAKYIKEYNDYERLHDNISISFLQRNIINTIYKNIIKIDILNLEKDKDYNRAIPKNFLLNDTFSCFSRTWLLSSFLLKVGFKKNDLFFIQGIYSEDSLFFNHAYLIIKLADNSFLRIDPGLKRLNNINTDLAKNLDMLYTGHNSCMYIDNNSKKYGLDIAFYILKLNDGISQTFLLNLAYSKLDNGDMEGYKDIVYNLYILDPTNSLYIEAIALYYYKIGDLDKSMSYAINGKTILSKYIAAKYFLSKSKYKEAYKIFDSISIVASRGIDESIKTDILNELEFVKSKLKENEGNETHTKLEIIEYIKGLLNSYYNNDKEKYQEMLNNINEMSEIDISRLIHFLGDITIKSSNVRDVIILGDIFSFLQNNRPDIFKRIIRNANRYKLAK